MSIIFNEFLERISGSKWGFVFIAVVYLALTAGFVFVQRPLDEEMMHANIAATFLKEGRIACPIWDWAGLKRWTDCDRYMYWMPPGAFFFLAGWFAVTGFGLIQLRFFSVFWGLIGLAAWFFFFKKLGIQEKKVLFVALLLTATDFIYTRFATHRPFDIMLTAFLPLALISYLHFREISINKAILLSQAIVVISGIVHPNALLIWTEVTWFTIYLDRKNLRWSHAVYYLIPYLIGGIGMLYHVTRDFELFRIQFFSNVEYSGDNNFWERIYGTVRREFLVAYGFLSTLPSVSRALIFILIVYLGSIFFLFANKRNEFHTRVILILTLIHFFFFTFVFTHKWPSYVTYFIPLFAVCTALVWNDLSTKSVLLKAVSSGAILMMILMSLSANGFRYRKNEYIKKYLPDMQTAKQMLSDKDTVFANAETAFELGMERVLHDSTLGYFNKQERNFVLVDGFYESLWEWYERDRPEVYAHIRKKLDYEYKLVYTGNFYKIYKRNRTQET